MTQQQPLATLDPALTGTRLPVYRCYPGPLIESYLRDIHDPKFRREVPRWRAHHATRAFEEGMIPIARELLRKRTADSHQDWLDRGKGCYSRIISAIEAGRVALPQTGDQPWDELHMRANALHRDWLAGRRDSLGRPSIDQIALLGRARELVRDVIIYPPVEYPSEPCIDRFDALYDQLAETYAARRTTA